MDNTTTANLPLQSGAGDDHPDTSGDNTAIVIGGAAQAGVIGVPGDLDRFRVELNAGASYRFELKSGSKAFAYTQLALVGSNGSVLARDSGGGKDGGTLINFVAPASGTYYLDAMGNGANTGPYTVSAIQTATAPVTPQPDPGTSDDFPANNGTTGLVVPNGVAGQGRLERFGDVDYFKVALEANVSYTFSLQGTGSLQDTFLRLHAEDGRLVAFDDDGAGTKNGAARITFTAPSSGTYYLDASSYANQTGAYTLVAVRNTTTPVTPQPDPNDDYPATNNTTGVVVPNGAAAQGQLERAGDIDYLKVMLEANASYTFSVQGLGDGSLQDTLLRVHAADGRTLVSDDDGSGTKNGGSRISFTAPSSGAYYLAVSSDRDERGAYTVSAVADDFPATTATPGLLTVNGAASRGVLETGRDMDWLRVDLRGGVLYQLDIEGVAGNAGSPALASPGVSLRTADGTGSKTGVERTSFVAPADGSYYVHVEARDRTSTGTYAVKATTLPDDQPSSNATTGVVQVNGTATTGRIDAPTDVDYFKVQLNAGTWYSFALSGTDGAGALVDTYLRLRGADGRDLASNDDGTKNSNSSSALKFQAPASGTYYLEASGDGNLVGGYMLSAYTALSIAESTPARGATEVTRSANLVLTMDRPVVSNHGTVTIQASSDHGGGMQLISLDDASQVTIDGRTITINPASDLNANSKYFVNFSHSALKDTNGNVLEGLTEGSLSFTTVALNRAPTAADHQAVASSGIPVSGVLPRAVDADGDAVQYLVQQFPTQGGALTLHADGRYTYEAPYWFSGSDQFRFTVKDSQGATNTYTATVNATALPVVQGTPGVDTLTASAGSHRYTGLDGNDRITTGAGPDFVDGGGGTDTLVLSVPRSEAALQRRPDGGWTVTTAASGTDQVFDVERVQFTDVSRTLGTLGTADSVFRVVGSVFGKAHLYDPAVVGRYLALADNGMGGDQLVQQVLADPLFAALAGSRSNEDVVRHVYTNIVGNGPTPVEVDYYASLITSGQYSQNSLLWWAASLDLTAQRIDLAGLASSGVDFLPVPA